MFVRLRDQKHGGETTMVVPWSYVKLWSLDLWASSGTIVDHITFIFSMFLFYVSPSVSTLVYTTWYNISRC